MDYTLLTHLIPPAIVISALAYLTSFFGKTISDQIPFTDDRKWHIEIAGVLFITNLVTGGLIGVSLANAWTWGTNHWWLHVITLVVFSFVGASLLLNNKFKS
jgi:hypothetical protein